MMAPLIDHLWQSTLVAVVSVLLVLSLRRNGARVRYWVWFAASVKFLIPFSALVALGAATGWSGSWKSTPSSAVQQNWTMLVETVAQPMAVIASPSGEATPAAAGSVGHDSVVDWAALALGTWMLGSLTVLGAWVARWLRLRRVVLAARPVRISAVPESIPVRVASSGIEPGVFGIFAPVIVVPEGLLERLSPPQLRAVLEHEICHVRRRDNLTAAVHMLVESLFWFHPLVWWIGARLLDEREQACDEAVIAAGIDRDAYGEGILEVCRYCIESPLPCAAGVGAVLKNRIERIAQDRGCRPLGFVGTANLSIAAVASLAVPVGIGLLESARAVAQPPAAEDTSAQVYIETVENGEAAFANGPLILAGVLIATHLPLRQLVAFAYDVDQALVVGPPELDSLRFSIKATIGASDAQRQMQDVLARRFGLISRWETRAVPIFELVALPEADSVLSPADVSQLARFIRSTSDGVALESAPIVLLKRWLSTCLGRPVVDRTGLTGRYTFRLAWDGSSECGTTSGPSAPDELVRALESQAGLSLLAGVAPVNMLVVDYVRAPTDSPPPEGTLSLGADALDRYVGFYGIREIGWIVRVERESEHLVVHINANGPHSVYPRSETVFAAGASDLEIEFAEENGLRVLVLRSGDIGGLTWPALRREPSYPIWGPALDAAAADAQLADIEARFASQTPVAAGDEIFRRIVRVLTGEEALPAEGGFDPARSIHDALEREWTDSFAARGELVSAGFTAVNRMGQDVYEIAFENFAFDVVLGVDPAGNVMSLTYRVGAFPLAGGFSVGGVVR